MIKRNILKNFSYSIGANLLSLLVSALLVFIVPKLIGVKEYGYWQLYMFYSSYIGFFHFGWCDGVYLRYGGFHYNNLNKRIFSSEFWFITGLEFVLSLILGIIVVIVSPESDKFIILMIVIISITIVISRTFLSFILQTTNRIKEYSLILIIEKVIYVILLSVFFCIGVKSHVPLLISDLIAKGISLLLAIFYCKDIVFSKKADLKSTYIDIAENLKVGSKLLIANIASMLILGIIRLAIENNWSIEVFGKVSLSINLSNMLMTFINAIGIVLFPILKRTDRKTMNLVYDNLKDMLLISTFALLTLYYPIKAFFLQWLPQYADSLKYMALLFPICVYEAKMSLLINTYLKVLRKEKTILFCNLFTVFISLITTFFAVYVLNSLIASIVSIIILLAIRCIISEIFLSKYFNKNEYFDILLEILLSLIFIFSGWYLGGYIGFAVYIVFFIIYLIIKKDRVKNLFLYLKQYRIDSIKY